MIIRVSYDGLTTGSYTSYECQCEDHGPLDGNKTHQTRVHLHIRFGESWDGDAPSVNLHTLISQSKKPLSGKGYIHNFFLVLI